MIKIFGLISTLTIFALYLLDLGNPFSTSRQTLLSPAASTIPLTVHGDDYFQDKAASNFKKYCSGCHGESMEAFTDRQWKYGKTKQDLVKSVQLGHPEGGMPPFEATLSAADINGLADYILKGIENVSRYTFSNKPKSNIFKTSSLTVQLDTVAQGLQNPWGLAFLPNGDMLVTERSGKMFRITKNKMLEPIDGVPDVVAEGQGGLLDVELHPDFKNNNVVYISYSIPKKTDSVLLSTTAVTRAVLNGNSLSQQKVIFEALPYSKTRHHYGSRLEFDKAGNLYVSVGDRGNHDENPQNLDNYCGKVHRIKEDGSIPADNPFVNKPGAMPTIYSYGHRNPQGMAINPATGVIWTHEHGPRGGDEVNIIQKAKNYGWPVISYGLNYNGSVLTANKAKEGMEQPQLYWIPSIAPSGLVFVQGDRYKAWKGHLLVGSLRFKYLNLCKISGNKITSQEIMLENIGRVRNVAMGPDGYIYVSVENPGAIFRLSPVTADKNLTLK